MKLTCDLCGGPLQMNAGAQDASCKNCGLCYSLEMLRQKLGLVGSAPKKASEAPQPPVTPTPPVERCVVTPEARPQPKPVAPPVVEQPRPKPMASAVAEQFVMPVETLFAACLSGTVQQGCIGVGERVYINGDYSKPYRLYRFGNDIDTTHASAGQYTRLYLVPHRKDAMKQARVVTGDPNPTANAYRFSGSVEGYFADVFQKNFPEYTLQKQVDWPGLKIPVTFMLLKNGRPVVAIFVFDSHDAHSRYQAEKARTLIGDAYIGCTHFFKDYRNDESYVVDRIRSAMGN